MASRELLSEMRETLETFMAFSWDWQGPVRVDPTASSSYTRMQKSFKKLGAIMYFSNWIYSFFPGENYATKCRMRSWKCKLPLGHCFNFLRGSFKWQRLFLSFFLLSNKCTYGNGLASTGIEGTCLNLFPSQIDHGTQKRCLFFWRTRRNNERLITYQ